MGKKEGKPRSNEETSQSSAVVAVKKSNVAEDLSTLSDELLPPQKRVIPAGRPDFPGHMGTAVRLSTNHFHLTLPSGVVYQYTITMEPPWARPYRKSDKALYQQVLSQWRKVCPPVKKSPYCWVYDGDATLYSTKAHKDIPNCTVLIINEDKELEFRVVDVKLVKPIPISQDLAEWAGRGQSGHTPQTALHALDVILNQAVVTDLNYTTVGWSYVMNDGHVLGIGMGKEVWTGLFSSTTS